MDASELRTTDTGQGQTYPSQYIHWKHTVKPHPPILLHVCTLTLMIDVIWVCHAQWFMTRLTINLAIDAQQNTESTSSFVYWCRLWYYSHIYNWQPNFTRGLAINTLIDTLADTTIRLSQKRTTSLQGTNGQSPTRPLIVQRFHCVLVIYLHILYAHVYTCICYTGI